ncbi:hypothetical protein B0T16DRAFT_450545 [Cercophora newfieldiana]|uniref:DUF427 domain-containing protein n=1 Tax=Cercophora newfieldiana TaxID=92897 RepID=A0AA39YLH2_9PEZI|nr:hypothetical protein B0T16DRAFT_450545 [Cercophora newfieldiana]
MPGPPGGNLSLPELAAKLCTQGPVKQEPANRRVRGVLGGIWVFDTLEAQYVWEHPYFPFFYIPIRALTGVSVDIEEKQDPSRGFSIANLVLSGHGPGLKSAKAIVFEGGPLDGLVKIPHGSLDAWYVEDEKLLGIHPKDPYRRVDCHASSREIRIEVDSAIIAESRNNVFLYETGLRPRYYLSPSAIMGQSIILPDSAGPIDETHVGAFLIPSKTSTVCPYKGQASYYHLVVRGKTIEDVAWYYTYPTPESAPIRNMVCFYNEKVDVFVDGEKEER